VTHPKNQAQAIRTAGYHGHSKRWPTGHHHVLSSLLGGALRALGLPFVLHSTKLGEVTNYNHLRNMYEALQPTLYYLQPNKLLQQKMPEKGSRKAQAHVQRAEGLR
jgi:hypothetical protein